MILNSRSPRSTKIKFALFFVALIIIGGTLIYTKILVEELQKNERKNANLYARAIEYVANSNTPGGDFNFIFNEIVREINFPMIETDAENKFIKSFKNISIDSTKDLANQKILLLSKAKSFDEINEPIKIIFQDTIVLSNIHYGESQIITELRYLPLIEILIVSLFILVAYISFSFIKKNEQSNIWVGMARETAHQLGTPISSMMGWIEIISMKSNNNPELEKIIFEAQKDISRLKKISDRFSKIGSKPELKNESLNELIQNAIDYFSARIPQFGKKVEFDFNPQIEISVKLNKELFEWVLENLIKNSLDAIENNIGKIKITTVVKNNFILIDLSDNGKGMTAAIKKDIFRPGFSTKTRGWGLGLSLAKRIVEVYHNGKLTVASSSIGIGTTFRIKIPNY